MARSAANRAVLTLETLEARALLAGVSYLPLPPTLPAGPLGGTAQTGGSSSNKDAIDRDAISYGMPGWVTSQHVPSVIRVEFRVAIDRLFIDPLLFAPTAPAPTPPKVGDGKGIYLTIPNDMLKLDSRSGGSSTPPQEDISLHFSKIEVKYSAPGSTPTHDQPMSYDQATAKNH
jgi:hypothetical protein